MSSDNRDAADGERQGEPASFAERLDRLFKLTADADGHEHTYRAVAAEIEAAGGSSVSASYLHALRTGQKDNPTKRYIEGLAAYFGVPPAYFFDDKLAAEVDAQLAMLRTLRDNGVMDVALRARGLSAESLDHLARLIERTRSLEGLDDRGKTRRYKPRPPEPDQ